MANAIASQVQALYVGYLGRAADQAGLDFWTNAITAGTSTIESVALGFTLSQEYTSKYEGLSNEELAAAIYQNVLGRAADADGLAFWVGELEKGVQTPETLLAAMINSLGAVDQKVIDNKVYVANAYTAAAGADYKAEAGAKILEGVDGTDASVAKAIGTLPTSTETITLTTGTDAIVGASGNDTITGTSTTLQAGDVILDQSSTDNDNLNLTLTAVNALATVTGIENVNVDWNAFGTANYDADNTSGATITGTSSKVGFLGSFTVDNTGANNVVAGAGMVGTLQVNDATDTTVTGTAAKVINVDGSATREDNVAAVVTAGAATTTIDVGAIAGFDSVTVTGGAATTSVTVDDSAAITVDAAAATTVTLDGTTETDDTATVTLGVDADLQLGAGAEIETVTVNAADGITVDITGSDIKNLTVASAGAVTLVATSTELKDNTVTDEAESLNIEVAHTGADDLSKVSADLITLTSTNGSALTFATGANVLVAEDVDLNVNASFIGKSATTGTLNLTVLADQTNDIDVTTLKTLNLTVELNADDADEVATLGGITSANDVVLTSANDVDVTALDVKNLDASAATGALTVAFNSAAAATDLVSLVGSQGNNDVTLTTVAADVSVVTGEGDDVVTLAGTDAAGDVTLVLGNGDNEVDAGTTGINGKDLSIVTGTGDDVVDALLKGTVNFVAELGDGANEVTFDTSDAGAQNVTIVTGAGADTIIVGASTDVGDVLSITAGTGTDTLDINAVDISAGDITLNGVEQIEFTNGTSVVDASLLTGETFKLLGQGNNASGIFSDQLDVTIATAGSYNFSSLTFGNTLTDGAAGLSITGSVAGSDTIVATTGNDTIVASAAGTNTITGGKGQDDLSSNGSTTTFVFAAGDSGKTATTADIIQDFVTGTDKLKIGITGSATTFAAIEVDTGSSDDLANAGVAVTAANTLFGAGQAGEDKSVLFLYDGDTGADGWLAIDRNGDAVVDELIQLVGLTAGTDVVAADIIA